ncbi:MAG: hemolysin family protein [Tildeniella nuda ZEHNDER 1965/U140]|nr:hemolysin family protein [Tildeniella nuda ZEHNDER 1965/U140]
MGLIDPSMSELTWSAIWVRILLVLLLIAINAFFVAAEFSMVAVRRSRISQLVDAGDVQARTVQALQQSTERLLSTTQLGITLSSLALGWIGESALAVLVAHWLRQLPLPDGYRQALAHSVAIPATFLLLAYFQIVLGELCPKAVALLYSEQMARFLAAPSLAIARFFHPFIWVLNQSTRLLLRLGGIQYTGQAWSSQVTPEELQLIIAMSSESSGLEAEERQLLRNVFEFGDVSAGEVMVTRTNIDAVPYDATFKLLLQEAAQSGHLRYPVIGESLDDVRGLIYFQELAEPLAQEAFDLEHSIQAWLRPARFVPEYMLLSELLPLMQRSRQPMMMVVDEYGGTAGLVTIEDLIAEILGVAAEPANDEATSIQVLDEQTFLVQAQIDLEEVNELLNLDLPLSDDYQTLGGFLLFQLQKIPQLGESSRYGDSEFTIISAEGPRLHQIQIHRLEVVETLHDFTVADTAVRDTDTENTGTESTGTESNAIVDDALSIDGSSETDRSTFL